MRPGESTSPGLEERLTAARTFIERHFRDAPSLGDIAQVAQLSPCHFHRVFRNRYGKTAKQMMTQLQIAEVQRLIAKGTPLPEVARATGFPNRSHMSNRFKQLTGTTPARWGRDLRRARETRPTP